MKGDVVKLCKNSDRIGANFIGKVAIVGNAVGPKKYSVYLAAFHKRGCHVIADERVGDTIFFKLPSCEPAAL